jgi:tetratricopeptide (TPR) repeat protein
MSRFISRPRLWLPLLTSLALAEPTMAATQADGTGAKGSPRAEARAQAKVEVAKAQVDYKLGRFERALAGYSRAYELFPAPGLLFNLGQCHRNLKDYERAIFFFEGYLREQPRLDRDQRALTEDLIAESRAGLERQRSAASAGGARFATPDLRFQQGSGPPPGATTRMASLSIAASGDPEGSRDETSIAHRWWFWTAIAAATVAAAGAAVYYTTGDARIVLPAGTAGTLDRR